MLNLVDLLVELRALLVDPDGNWDTIVALLDEHQELAEYQVARFVVASAGVTRVVGERLASVDPVERHGAVRTIRAGFPRSSAARLLRRVLHDADPRVSKAARVGILKLGLDDSDTTGTPGPRPSAWSFGMFADPRRYTRRPGAPTRVQALARYGLPPIADVEALATLLGLANAQALRRFMRPGAEAGSGYVEFEVPKAKGGTRRIAAPRAPLRKLQRTILDQILAKLPPHPASHGFVVGRSTVTNAAPHQGAAVVLKHDLKDFFPTVHFRRVAGLFRQLGYSHPVADALASLSTYRPKLDGARVLWPGVLPQGAPTSPALANLACRRLDARLAALAAKVGATYTRYADDLTFSFAAPPTISIGRFHWWIDCVCHQEGFTERTDKRRVLRSSRQQRITGVVVNQGLHVPRAERQRFRAILHNSRKLGLASQARGRDDFADYLAGYAAYVRMIEPELGARWAAEVAALIGESNG